MKTSMGLKTGAENNSFGLKSGQDLEKGRHIPTKNSQEYTLGFRVFFHTENALTYKKALMAKKIYFNSLFKGVFLVKEDLQRITKKSLQF